MVLPLLTNCINLTGIRFLSNESEVVKVAFVNTFDSFLPFFQSLKEGLTVQERMKLFEAKDSRKI